MLIKRANQEERIFLFLRLQRVLLYSAQRLLIFVYFFKKDVKQWKFCTSKGNIGTDDKRGITVTFIINLHGTILPMQLISGGKTVQSLNKFDFLEGFPAESTKMIK